MKRRTRSGAAASSAHLLDTSTLLWALGEPERLSAKARRLVDTDDNVLVSRAAGEAVHYMRSSQRKSARKGPLLITRDGVIEPASYVNFAITTHLVVVPTFGSPNDEAGVAAIAALFPDRDTIGLPGDAVLAGGGGFHCASQQMPQT